MKDSPNLSTTSPLISTLPNGLVFEWERERVRVSMTGFRPDTFRSSAQAELLFQYRKRKTGADQWLHVYQGDIALKSLRSKRSLAGDLTATLPDIDWRGIIEVLCVKTLEHTRKGEPWIMISTNDETPRPTYSIYPLIPEGQPTIIHGAGGSLKSHLACCLGVMLTLPWKDNPLGFTLNGSDTRVGYADWETDEKGIAWTVKKICRGHGLPYVEFFYRRCSRPLVDDSVAFMEFIKANGITHLIVDSLAPACGGADLNDSEPAAMFYNCIRDLHVTPIILAHPAASGKLYGSVFFRNLARCVWVMKSIDITKDVYAAALFHDKINSGPKHPPIGLKVKFYDDRDNPDSETLYFERDDNQVRREFDTDLPMPERILNYLEQMGAPVTNQDLAVALGTTTAIINTNTARLRTRGKIELINEGFILTSTIEDAD